MNAPLLHVAGEYGLLLGNRPSIAFKEVPGTVEIVDSSLGTGIKPLLITERSDYDYVGYASGGRSGLLGRHGGVIKVKGCAIRGALDSDGPYRTAHKSRPPASSYDLILARIFDGCVCPSGGQFLRDSHNEISRTLEANDILAAEGFPVAYTPLAVIGYGRDFATPPFVFQRKRKLGATVMAIKGDTRLPEIYTLQTRDEGAMGQLAYCFGLYVGAQKRVLDQKIAWGVGNAHAGNVLVFENSGGLHTYPMDLDGAERRTPWEALVNPTLPDERRSLLGSLRKSASLLTHGKPKQNDCASEAFIHPFEKGFLDGYRRPDTRKPITLEMLCGAVDLKQSTSGVSGVTAPERSSGDP